MTPTISQAAARATPRGYRDDGTEAGETAWTYHDGDQGWAVGAEDFGDQGGDQVGEAGVCGKNLFAVDSVVLHQGGAGDPCGGGQGEDEGTRPL